MRRYDQELYRPYLEAIASAAEGDARVAILFHGTDPP
jgi:hypothetical protein